MTIEGLHHKLKATGIPENWYYLQGLYGSTNDDDKIALKIQRGKYFIEYEVYYKERGQKYSSNVFTDENEACEYIYKNLLLTKKNMNYDK